MDYQMDYQLNNAVSEVWQCVNTKHVESLCSISHISSE